MLNYRRYDNNLVSFGEGAHACKAAESAGGINRMNSNCAARRSIANLSLSLSLRFPALLVLFQILDATSKLSYVHARIRAPPSLAEVSRINVPDRVGPREIRCSLIAKQRLIRFPRAAPRGQMDATIWFRIYGSLFIIYIYIYHALFRTRPVSAVLRKLSVLWKSGGKGGGERNESGKVSREERKREREREICSGRMTNLQIFLIFMYIYIHIHLWKKYILINNCIIQNI